MALSCFFRSDSSKNACSYKSVMAATDGFSPSRLIGHGVAGRVYRGSLGDGREVAVKVIEKGCSYGDREFQTILDVLGRVHHRGILPLLGWCTNADSRMLVYDYLPGKDLSQHLKGGKSLNWQTRFKIAYECAIVLAYLHDDCTPRIIHRNFGAKSILLDHSFQPKIAGFGMAEYSGDKDSDHIYPVMGTYGYADPEHVATGKLTTKADVYSFGVVLLQLITGMSSVITCAGSLSSSWARPLLEKALLEENCGALADNPDEGALVDARLGNDYDSNEMKRAIACAAACLRSEGRRRPDMNQIVRVLEGRIPLEFLVANETFLPGHEAPSEASDGHYEAVLSDTDLPR